jgi:integrase
MEWEGENPAKGFTKWPENSSFQSGLEVDEVGALLKSAVRSVWPKMRLLILMAIVTGLRRGNLMALRYRDVDDDGNTASVGRTKNGLPFTAVMTTELVAEYRLFYSGASPDDLIFEGSKKGRPYVFDKEYRVVCNRAGLSHINFHTLRHTCASIAARSGASTIEIMDLLNHRTPTMAARYSHLSVEHRKRRAPEIFKGIGAQD